MGSPHGGFLAGWQVSIGASAVLVSAAAGLSKGWISCSNKCKKTALSVAWFWKALMANQAALRGSCLACCQREGGWDCVALRAVSHVHMVRRDLFRVEKCWSSELPLERNMGEGGKSKDQCL